MRVILITLSLAAFIFMGSIMWIFTQNNESFLSKKLAPPSEKTGIEESSLLIETIKQQIKTEQKIDEIKKGLDAITNSMNTSPSIETPQPSHSGNLDNQKKDTDKSTPDKVNPIDIIPISAKFLSKILPTIDLTLIKNAGIFGLYTFDHSLSYSTYKNDKFNIIVIASLLPYETFLKNFKTLDKTVFTINETATFPFPSFYVNPPKADNMVRIVFAVERQTLLVSLPKAKFDQFKNLIIQPKKS